LSVTAAAAAAAAAAASVIELMPAAAADDHSVAAVDAAAKLDRRLSASLFWISRRTRQDLSACRSNTESVSNKQMQL